MLEATLEQRLIVVEEAILALQAELHARKTAADWLDRVIGSMKDEPDFDDVLALGQSIRQADRPAESRLP